MGTVGLTLGKFAPLHQGHEFLLQTALAETDHVIVVIYDAPSVTVIPLPVRANWIRALYPQIEVIEAWGGPEETGDTPEIKAKQEAFLEALLQRRRITHFFSSEFYGEHMSRMLRAENRVVDAARLKVPISATRIRNNPFEHRNFLSPLVYRDFILNVVFMGAPSTGKTTLAQACAQCFGTTWMPEYGREYWEENQVERRLSLDQLVELAEGHLQREDEKIQPANRWLFTDTNALTTYHFSLHYHGTAAEKLVTLAGEAEKRYDVFFLCDTDIPYDDTPDRSGAADRDQLQKIILGDLQNRKIPFHTLSGSREARVESVVKVLHGLKKFGTAGVR